MKKTMKTLVTAVLATALIAGIQMTVLAAASVSEADNAETTPEVVVGEVDNDDDSDNEEINDMDDDANMINQSPNTGVTAAPLAAALLAAGSVPVIAATRKKK